MSRMVNVTETDAERTDKIEAVLLAVDIRSPRTYSWWDRFALRLLRWFET